MGNVKVMAFNDIDNNRKTIVGQGQFKNVCYRNLSNTQKYNRML